MTRSQMMIHSSQGSKPCIQLLMNCQFYNATFKKNPPITTIMERYEIALENAKKNIRVADHMLSVTYKLVNDPKMLLAVMERINNALSYSVASILHYERLYKREC